MLEVLMWGLLTLIFDVVLKYELFVHYDYFKDKDLLKYFKSYWRDISLMVYFLIFPVHFGKHTHSLLILDIFVITLFAKRCK